MKIQRFHNCSPWVKSEGEKPRAKPQTNILPSCVHKNHKKYCSGGPKAIGTAKNTRNGLQDVQAEVLMKWTKFGEQWTKPSFDLILSQTIRPSKRIEPFQIFSRLHFRS